jgi:hypothetical protein
LSLQSVLEQVSSVVKDLSYKDFQVMEKPFFMLVVQ